MSLLRAIPLLLLVLPAVFACKCVFQRPEVVLCKADWAARLHVLSRSKWFGRTVYRVELEHGIFLKHPNTSEFGEARPHHFDIATESDCALDDLRVGAEYLLTGSYEADSGLLSFITKHFKELSGNFVVDRCSQVADSKGHVFEWRSLPKRLEKAIVERRLNLCWNKNG
uniref:NTR domain-containing protein n=1 Tax=Steinernema glaseri TaxID=37863 RepID=A0A1I8AMN9_9BILA